MKNINLKYETEREYRDEIERLTVIIENTPSGSARRRASNRRMRLQKELFVLINRDI